MVATHISLCDECRARLGEFEAVGGQVLERGDTVALADTSLEQTLARISGDAPAGDDRKTMPQRSSVFPAPLRDYVGGDADAVHWRAVGGGVRQAILPTSNAATVRLLHIPAGAAVPDHGHRGTELTLVLQGAFRDEEDRFARGDIEIADEEVQHTPVAEAGEDCICLAATDAPLRFRALIPRLAQPFLRI